MKKGIISNNNLNDLKPGIILKSLYSGKTTNLETLPCSNTFSIVAKRKKIQSMPGLNNDTTNEDATSLKPTLYINGIDQFYEPEIKILNLLYRT